MLLSVSLSGCGPERHAVDTDFPFQVLRAEGDWALVYNADGMFVGTVSAEKERTADFHPEYWQDKRIEMDGPNCMAYGLVSWFSEITEQRECGGYLIDVKDMRDNANYSATISLSDKSYGCRNGSVGPSAAITVRDGMLDELEMFMCDGSTMEHFVRR